MTIILKGSKSKISKKNKNLITIERRNTGLLPSNLVFGLRKSHLLLVFDKAA
jgi:hypothetical protein